MNQHALRVTRSDSRFPQKRDSVKTALPLRRREKVKRRVFSKHKCPTLLEEPEGDDETTVKSVGQVRGSAVPVPFRSALRLSRPAISEKARGQTAPSVTPADKKVGHQKVSQTACLTNEVTSVLKGFEDDTLDSVISCSLEPGSTLNLEKGDDEDDDDRCSSSSTTLSSLLSPEIFRKESVETTNFSNKNELLRVNLIKNSTLLESSHAENIHLHHPPDISIIIGDAAMSPAKKNCEITHQEISDNRSKIQTDSVESEPIGSSHKRKTPPNFTKRKLILCKKKVWFKSPITTEMFQTNHMSPSPSVTRGTSESSGQMRLDPVVSKMGEISSNSETLPATRSSATFFDFGSDNEGEAFFQRMRKRSAKLRSFVFPSRLDTQTPPTL